MFNDSKHSACRSIIDQIFQTYVCLSVVEQLPVKLPEHLKTGTNTEHILNLRLDQILAVERIDGL